MKTCKCKIKSSPFCQAHSPKELAYVQGSRKMIASAMRIRRKAYKEQFPGVSTQVINRMVMVATELRMTITDIPLI